MGIIGDFEKTLRYAARNGVRETWYAALERLKENMGASYIYEAPALDVLEKQKQAYTALSAEKELPLISFLVPLYEPDEKFLREMILSVLSQTYGNYELVIADGSTDNAALPVISSFESDRIVYFRLRGNGGISANTNEAAARASGAYVALLDYDDLLTPDAVCRVTETILALQPEIIYSDEDKCDSTGKKFFDPNRKPDFNPDYFLANNYICHLLVMKTELFKALRLRSEFDGAQDYDLMLRAPWSGIVHIPEVLYHWRTHKGSTAGNPGSKDYAYEAGKRALEDYFRCGHIDAEVTHSRHRGFYRVEYRPDIFTARPDVGVVGGKVLDARRRIVGGMMDEDGKVLFEGMHEMESGRMHRADTVQDAAAVDVRCMQIRDELRPLYMSVFNTSYDDHVMRGEDSLVRKSIEFCRKAREQGYFIVWDPFMTRRV